MVCHAVTVQNQGGEHKVGLVLRVGYLLKKFSSNRGMVIQYAKKALPHTQALADATLRILLGYVAPSTGVEAGDVLPVRHHLRALHLHRRQRRPY